MDYWIAIDKQKIGPLSLDEVRQRRLAPDTLVWHQGLPAWREAASLPELADALSTSTEITETVTVESETPHQQATPAAATPPVAPPVFREPVGHYSFHAQPAPAPRPESIPDKPTTYMGWNIAAIILCCFLTGIIGVIFSSKVSSRYAMGDYDGARKASETAGLMLIISIVIGLVALPFQILMNLV